MGKVNKVKKSRKEFKCSKCGEIIPAGSTYYRGELNFAPAIVRCEKCGLASWEVTTSDYLLSVGSIVNNWSEDYSLDAEGIESMSSDLEEIRSDLEDRLDNMPEGLRYSDTGELLQSRIDGLEGAISGLGDIDVDDVTSEASEEIEESNDGDDLDTFVQDKISEAIEDALSSIEC